jgi:hypothetical protein
MQSLGRKSGFLEGSDFSEVSYHRRHLGRSSYSEGHWDLSSLNVDLESASDWPGTRVRSIGNFVPCVPLKVRLDDPAFDGRHFTKRDMLSICSTMLCVDFPVDAYFTNGISR